MNAYSGSQKDFESDRNEGDVELATDYGLESSYFLNPNDKPLYTNSREKIKIPFNKPDSAEKSRNKSDDVFKSSPGVKQLCEYSKKIQERIALSNKTMELNIQAASQELKSQQQSLEDFNTTLQGTVSLISSQIETMNSKVQGMRETYTQRFQQLNECFDTIAQTLSEYDSNSV